MTFDEPSSRAFGLHLYRLSAPEIQLAWPR